MCCWGSHLKIQCTV
uniref:Uncharacterized protein n=1 Tax=Rhizophora mucronata TaxID=61149 RepID=A0A2P2QDZ1_RHIMU